MSYNENTITTTEFGFGPGTILIGPYNPTAAGGTPSVSVGAVDGDANISLTRDVVPVMQGVPAREVASFVSKEHMEISYSGIQWNLPMFYRALGGGTEPTTSSPNTTFNFGNDVLMSDLALQSKHRLPDGSTVTLNVWKARGNGQLPISMAAAGVHKFNYTFVAVEGTSDWTNTALAQKAKLWQMIYTTKG